LIKNSQPFGKKFQKTVGGIFLTHTVYHAPEIVTPMVCIKNYLFRVDVKGKDLCD